MKSSKLKVQSSKLKKQRGAILLLVMWATAALSLVALALALSVRTELAATQYRLEAEQGRFLARGALEQALYVLKNAGLQDAHQKRLYEPGQPHLDFSYDTGTARVEVRSESGKLNVNAAPVERLRALLEAAGAGPQPAGEIAEAMVDWRSAASPTLATPLDQFYAGLAQPYRASHRPFERLEELLLVRGVTAELYYGWIERGEDQRLVRRGGLNRLLSVYGGFGPVNVNEAPLEVLLSVPGLDAESARALVAGRRQRPYRSMADLPLSLPLEAVPHLAFSASSDLYSLTSTGRRHGSAARASVRAVFRREPTGETRLLLWEEMATSEEALEAAGSASAESAE